MTSMENWCGNIVEPPTIWAGSPHMQQSNHGHWGSGRKMRFIAKLRARSQATITYWIRDEDAYRSELDLRGACLARLGLWLVCNAGGLPLIGPQYHILLAILVIAKWILVSQMEDTSCSGPGTPGNSQDRITH